MTWPAMRLGDLVTEKVTYGIVQPGPYTDGGIPIVRVKDIRHGRIETNAPMRVAPEVAGKYPRSELRGGEVLLTLVGTVGEVAIAPTDVAGWNVARAVGVLRPTPEIGGRWLKIALQHPRASHLMKTWMTTTVQATLNLRDVAKIPIPMPPANVRAAIASILSAFDDKIELNRRTAETLEAVARAVFKSWFVDFDPVHAKAEGREPDWMDAETAALFPDRFGDDGLPEGWCSNLLDKISCINPDQIRKGNGPPEICYVDISSVSTGSIASSECYALEVVANTSAGVDEADAEA